MPSDGVAHPEIKLLAIIGDAGADAASAEGIPSDQPGSRASIGKVEPPGPTKRRDPYRL